jgi:TrpR family trp operon transcriptional repressor
MPPTSPFSSKASLTRNPLPLALANQSRLWPPASLISSDHSSRQCDFLLDRIMDFTDNGSKMALTKKTKSMHEIARACAATNDPRYILRFLNSLLTPNEIREISSRWELVKRLDQGHSQRQIAHQLGLSLCKITRGSRELKKKDSPFKRMIATLEKQNPGKTSAGRGKTNLGPVASGRGKKPA